MAKCYLRNGVWAWPVDRQRRALGDALDDTQLYQDGVRPDRAKAPSRIHPAWLTDRAQMLRPSGRRTETIHVATLLAIAVSEADLVSVLAAASARGATITASDSGIIIPPGGGAAEVEMAVADWQRARALAKTEPGRLEGVRIAAAKKRDRTTSLTKMARPLWRDTKPDRPTTDQVSAQVGLSTKTLYQELGRRPAIRKGRSDAKD